jgi:hypothetical protein
MLLTHSLTHSLTEKRLFSDCFLEKRFLFLESKEGSSDSYLDSEISKITEELYTVEMKKTEMELTRLHGEVDEERLSYEEGVKSQYDEDLNKMDFNFERDDFIEKKMKKFDLSYEEEEREEEAEKKAQEEFDTRWNNRDYDFEKRDYFDVIDAELEKKYPKDKDGIYPDEFYEARDLERLRYKLIQEGKSENEVEELLKKSIDSEENYKNDRAEYNKEWETKSSFLSAIDSFEAGKMSVQEFRNNIYYKPQYRELVEKIELSEEDIDAIAGKASLSKNERFYESLAKNPVTDKEQIRLLRYELKDHLKGGNENF